jgi:hypothetical protein
VRALEKNPVVAIIVIALVLTGCVDVIIDGDLSKGFKELLAAVDVPLAGLAVGRGLVAARRSR